MNLSPNIEKISMKGRRVNAEILICDGFWFESKSRKAVRQSVLNETGVELKTFRSVKGLTLYSRGFLIAHELKTLSIHFPMIQAYARLHQLKVGYFLNGTRDECVVLKDHL